MTVFATDDTDTPPASYLEALVGEGKKFSDPENLAKGKWEADKTIAQRNKELEDLRVEFDALKVKALLSQTPPPPKQEPEPVANQPAQPDLAELVREQLQRERENLTVTANVDQVAAKLTELYGDEDKANQIVKARAAELGVSVSFLEEVAAKSPKAFFAQLGIDIKATPNSSGPTKGDVNTAGFGLNNTVKPGTYKFYEALRKSDPKTWQRIQPQIHKEALEKGAAFFE